LKTRQLYSFYNIANSLVFNNALPYVKINIPKNKWYYGMSYAQANRARMTSARIAICVSDILEDMPLGKYSIEKILLHEMIHVYQYILAPHFNISLNWHDKETFDDFGQIAVDYGLIDNKNLLT
jgi:hypothetical protein